MRVRAGTGVLAALSLLFATAVGTVPATPPVNARLVPTSPGRVLPTRHATVSSLNWSGYADVGSNITAVNTTYKIPTVKAPFAGFSSAWAGIGGYNSSDLIQAGTEHDYAPGLGASYFAWYEILPASETQLTGCVPDPACTAKPGDTMNVGITQATPGNWNIAMSESGASNWTFSIALSYASTLSSAEWILEAPTVGAQTIITHLSTTTFDPNNTYVQGGVTKKLSAGGPVKIILSPGLVNEATPSAIDADGDGFNDCTYANSCAAPAS